jgi:hypothetical protein
MNTSPPRTAPTIVPIGGFPFFEVPGVTGKFVGDNDGYEDGGEDGGEDRGEDREEDGANDVAEEGAPDVGEDEGVTEIADEVGMVDLEVALGASCFTSSSTLRLLSTSQRRGRTPHTCI